MAIGSVLQIRAWNSKFAKEAEQLRLREEKKQETAFKEEPQPEEEEVKEEVKSLGQEVLNSNQPQNPELPYREFFSQFQAQQMAESRFKDYRNISGVETNPLQSLIEVFEVIRRDRERLTSEINFLLTTDDSYSDEKFVEFLDSLKLDISDRKKGQLLKLFDPYDKKGTFLSQNWT